MNLISMDRYALRSLMSYIRSYPESFEAYNRLQEEAQEKVNEAVLRERKAFQALRETPTSETLDAHLEAQANTMKAKDKAQGVMAEFLAAVDVSGNGTDFYDHSPANQRERAASWPTHLGRRYEDYLATNPFFQEGARRLAEDLRTADVRGERALVLTAPLPESLEDLRRWKGVFALTPLANGDMVISWATSLTQG